MKTTSLVLALLLEFWKKILPVFVARFLGKTGIRLSVFRFPSLMLFGLFSSFLFMSFWLILFVFCFVFPITFTFPFLVALRWPFIGPNKRWFFNTSLPSWEEDMSCWGVSLLSGLGHQQSYHCKTLGDDFL
jgi:hypothetical protein